MGDDCNKGLWVLGGEGKEEGDSLGMVRLELWIRLFFGGGIVENFEI